MSEHSKNIVGRFWGEVFNSPEYLDTVDEILSPYYRLHDLVYGEERGLDELKDILSRVHGFLVGTRVIIEDQQMAAAGGRVVTRFVVRVPLRYATDTIRGSARADEGLEYHGMSISRVSEGRVEESWLIWDALRAEEEIQEPDVDWRWPPWR